MANKKIIIIVVVAAVISLAVAGYFYWQKSEAPELTPEEQTLEQSLGQVGEAAGKITESATQGTLPSLDVNKNPLEKAPDINPVGQSNPFKDIKTNPFE